MTSTMDDDDKTNSNNTNKTTTAVAGTHAETPRVDTEAIEAVRKNYIKTCIHVKACCVNKDDIYIYD
jgi:hypothetical protein